MTDQFIIEEASAGQRADAFLAAQLGVSRSRAVKLLEGATVNGSKVKPSHTLREDDVVLLGEVEAETAVEPVGFDVMPPMPPVMFEDENLIVLNKPRGIVVHPGAGERVATLIDVLRANGRALSTVGPPERAGIVHRLDKDTSGLMVVCKTDAAHWKLAADFAERRVVKNYVALTCGVPPMRGRIEAPIDRHATHRKKFAVAPHGRDAITEYVVAQSWRKFARLDINLLTGRTHQIRVHLQYINHPVVGDALYGGEKRALDSAETPAVKAALQKLRGQALHAAKLQFEHPISGEKLSFAAPLPDEIAGIIAALDGTE